MIRYKAQDIIPQIHRKIIDYVRGQPPWILKIKIEKANFHMFRILRLEELNMADACRKRKPDLTSGFRIQFMRCYLFQLLLWAENIR